MLMIEMNSLFQMIGFLFMFIGIFSFSFRLIEWIGVKLKNRILVNSISIVTHFLLVVLGLFIFNLSFTIW